MKKIFRKLNGFILVFLMLFSVAFINVAKKSQKTEEINSVYGLETDETYLENLILSNVEIPSQYNMADYYPLVNENQKSSNFCWIYSPMKSLETALMIQRNEYFNFSETALAYLDYVSDIEKYGAAYSVFNQSGNFSEFVKIYQEHGLVLESDFSNEEFSDINSKNYADYSYVKDFATKELNSILKPYHFSSLSAYNKVDVTDEARIRIVKKFVKTYGSVFAGIEGGGYSGSEVGCFYKDSGAINVTRDVYMFYDYNRATHENNQAGGNYLPLNDNHAISIIGWNDDVQFGTEKGAFLAMNSWGYEGVAESGKDKSIRLFYIPYSYTSVLTDCATFICEGENEAVSIESASNSSFTTDILNSSKDLDNFFCYDDEIWVNYKLNLDYLDGLEVKISSGNKTFNGLFNITTDSEEKTVKVTLSNKSSFYGGYYTISFYDSGELIGKRGIFVYSGTELNYFKARTETALDIYSLDNAFANADNVATMNVPSVKSSGGVSTFYLEFSRSPINNKNTLLLSKFADQIKTLNMKVSNVEIVSSGNRDLETKYTEEELIAGLFRTNLKNEDGNLFRLQIGTTGGVNGLTLAEFNNCLIKFKLTINSILYENCERDYLFNFFISDRYSANTSNLYSIFYNLNGGENNESNITKYPKYSPSDAYDYTYDDEMTTFDLLAPTKIGFTFNGWFLDKDFTTQITRIDNTISNNLILYAKWESQNTNYFDINLALEGVKDYNKNQKNLGDTIIYGDSISVKFTFIKNTALENNNYTIHYYFYGTEIIDEYFSEEDILAIENSANKETNKYFNLNFPALKSGNHAFRLRVKVIINGLLEVVEETFIPVSIEKKNVVFGFDELEKTYDGTIKKPTVKMVEDFYAEDFAGMSRNSLFELVCGTESIKAGTYNYYVAELLNKNYTYDSSADSSKCEFVIAKREINLEWKEDFSPVYNGENHFPEYDVINIIPGDSVEFKFNVDECKNAGLYRVNILPSSISNDNYTVNPVADFEFEIKKAKIKIIMHSTTDRIQTKPERRIEPSFSVVGNYHSVADLDINISTEAFKATKSGNYSISCVIQNENYEAEVEKATYTLTGYYNVYYQLSNGKTYTERVEEGKNPIGVTKDQLGVSVFSKISYSDDYLVTGDDIYVEVDYKNYSFVVYTGIIFVVGAIIIFIIYLKKRENGVR